jgi:hypothetical protein
MSKGSTPRPYSISQQQFADNFDRIFRKQDPRTIEDAQNEAEAFDKIQETSYNKHKKQDNDASS